MRKIPLILTCAGSSSRYGDKKPKWAQTHPTGKIMGVESLTGLGFSFDIYLCVNSKAVNDLTIEGIQRAFESDIHHPIKRIFILDTASQVETVAKAIDEIDCDEFIVRDCDSFISVKTVPTGNFITFFDASGSGINIYNKSTIQVMGGMVTSIREKSAHSPLISVGLYGFKKADFKKALKELKKDTEPYLSDIYQNITAPITAVQANDYHDWGTKQDWIDYKQNYATFFLDIDGTLVKSSHKSFYPTWGETEALENNIRFINECYDSGAKYIVLTTSRTEDFRNVTEEQLKRFNLKYHRLVMGLPVCKRIVINDFDVDSGIIGCGEINIPRDSDKLELEYRARIGR